MRTLKEGWVEVCDQYLRKFCEKHDLSYADSFWVGSDTGTVVCVGDYFISIDDIRYDIDNNVPRNVYFEYEAYCSRIRDIELNYDLIFAPNREVGRLRHMNYRSFCAGAPGYTEEELENLEETYNSLKALKKEFETLCVSGTAQ